MTPSMWACRVDHIEHFDLLGAAVVQQKSSTKPRQEQSQGVVVEDDGYERDYYGRTWMHWAVRRCEPLVCLKVCVTIHHFNSDIIVKTITIIRRRRRGIINKQVSLLFEGHKIFRLAQCTFSNGWYKSFKPLAPPALT